MTELEVGCALEMYYGDRINKSDIKRFILGAKHYGRQMIVGNVQDPTYPNGVVLVMECRLDELASDISYRFEPNDFPSHSIEQSISTESSLSIDTDESNCKPVNILGF